MSDIGKLLENEGFRFDFFQAVQLLENSAEGRPEIGYLGPYDEEIVRIAPSMNLSFAPSDVNRLERGETEGGRTKWNLFQNFLGLYGPNAATPIFMAEMITQCIDDDDPLRDFLDIFNHRILSLYYRAWKKGNITVLASHDRDDHLANALCAMVGRDATVVGSENWKIEPERLLRYTSLLSSNSRSAAGLESIISDYFQLDCVRVVQYVPKRMQLSSANHNMLSSTGEGGALGVSIVLGDTINDIAGQFKVRIESLNFQRFKDFQPDGVDYEKLIFLVDMYTQKRLGYILELVLQTTEAEPMRISSQAPMGRLGRSSWIGEPRDKDVVVEIPVTR